MLKNLAIAAVGVATLSFAGAAIAAPVNPQGPEPYSAPDPVYTAHKIASSVTFKNGEPQMQGNDNGTLPTNHS